MAGSCCQLVKMVVMCQSGGSSSQTEDLVRSLNVRICCADFLCL